MNEDTAWSIDLCPKDLVVLEADIDRALACGQKTNQRFAKATRRKTTKVAAYAAAEGVDLAQVRSWARENGIPVSARGRVHGEVIRLFRECEEQGQGFLNSPEARAAIEALTPASSE